MASFFADDGADELPRTTSHPFDSDDFGAADPAAAGGDDAGGYGGYSSFADGGVEEVEEEITVESDGVPIRHVSGGYSPSPFSPDLEPNGGDGPILPPSTEMGREEGFLLREWRRQERLIWRIPLSMRAKDSQKSTGLLLNQGMRSIVVSSSVPEGKGVSSSASVEVASMSAIAAAYGLNIAPRGLALLCQKVENRVVGAPCGVMDQMASACGEANKLLAMVCQPAEVKELVNIPTHIRFWGLDSGIRHSVGGTDYGSVRVGTYMGRKMIKCAASDILSESEEYEEHGVDLLKSEASMEYLCNLPPHRYEAVYAKDIPEMITGDAFLEKYGDHNDAVTKVDPKRSYCVKAPTRHPIYENFRVEAFKALLTAAKTDGQLSALGELMYQCHYSYNACGLGSDGTDRLVNLVQEIQHRKTSRAGGPSLFGAKITGGGSGGSVCVIGKNCLKSSEEIFEIQRRYNAATGYLPIVFEGSSPGAGKFGYLKIRRRSA